MATISSIDIGTIYFLQHIESGEYICVLKNGIDYLSCFSSPDDALEFQTALKVQEHADLKSKKINDIIFSHFWLDGKIIERVDGEYWKY